MKRDPGGPDTCPAAALTLSYTAGEYYTFARQSLLVDGVEVVCQRFHADSSFLRNQRVLEHADLPRPSSLQRRVPWTLI